MSVREIKEYKQLLARKKFYFDQSRVEQLKQSTNDPNIIPDGDYIFAAFASTEKDFLLISVYGPNSDDLKLLDIRREKKLMACYCAPEPNE